jgi:hypothetical protein
MRIILIFHSVAVAKVPVLSFIRCRIKELQSLKYSPTAPRRALLKHSPVILDSLLQSLKLCCTCFFNLLRLESPRRLAEWCQNPLLLKRQIEPQRAALPLLALA